MTINIKKFIIFTTVLFLGLLNVNAEGSYKNELVKVGFSPLGVNDVKVTLHMSKPYSEPLRLLKKNDSEFVLILPETYNSAPQKPSISDVVGEVTDADVRLYSFVSNNTQNGYTKILIRTNGSTNLYPEAVASGGGHVLNSVQPQKTSTASAQKPQNAANTVRLSTGSAKEISNKTVVSQLAEKNKKEAVKDNKVASLSDKVTANKNLSKAEENKKSVKENTETPIVPLISDIIPNFETVKLNESISADMKAEIPLQEVKDIPETELPFVAENMTDIEASAQPTQNTTFIKIKQKAKAIAVKLVNKAKQSKTNILLSLIGIVMLGFALKFAFAVIKSAKSNPEDLTAADKPENSSNGEYSEFFKTLIDSEMKGDNPFVVKMPENHDDMKFEDVISPQQSHEDMLNVDQNLTWQEKFRAVQKNKKSLLNNDDERKENFEDRLHNSEHNNNETVEIAGNMNIENPIKKLKQDFRAVKKVLEKQKAAKNTENSINQEHVPEKIEIVNFEDYQKTVERPKVQVNMTSPITTKAPKILTQLKLSDKKGFYLVDYKDKVSLVGYLNDKVFKLNSYSTVKNAKMYARLSEKTDGNETYIVKFDNNKLLVDVDSEKMKLKLSY